MKKIFTILLAMLLILTAVPVAVMAAEESTPTVPTTSWDAEGNYDTSWYTEHETDTTYEIDSAQKLAGLLKLSRSNKFTGKTIYITADIDLGAHNWPAIGQGPADGGVYNAITTGTTWFEGTIEGKKGGVVGATATISNLISVYPNNSRAGFISRHVTGGVKNLTFDNAYVKGTRYSAVVSGDVRTGAAATPYVAENLTVKNSRVDIGTDGTVSDVAGLLYGAVNAFGGTLTMKNLSAVNSTVSGRKELGALVGRTTWGTLNIQDSVVADCTVSASSGDAGVFCGWTDMAKMTFSNCYASGVAFGGASSNVAIFPTTTKTTFEFKDCIIDAIGSFTNKLKGGDATACNITAPTMIDGASIRTTAGTNGLRFTSTMSAENLAKLGANYSFGTVITYADKLTQGITFTEKGLKSAGVNAYTNIKAKDGIYEDYDGNGGVKFNAALVGIDTEGKAVEYAARSYVDVVVATGVTIRVYSVFDAEKNERSMQYVANKALNDVKDTVDNQTVDGFAYKFEVSEYNSDATGNACTMTQGKKYSCYALAEWAVLKTWSSATA